MCVLGRPFRGLFGTKIVLKTFHFLVCTPIQGGMSVCSVALFLFCSFVPSCRRGICEQRRIVGTMFTLCYRQQQQLLEVSRVSLIMQHDP